MGFGYNNLIKIYKPSPYFLFFFFAIFLNYLPDISPYYLSLFPNHHAKVIGPLTSFAEPCPDSPVGEWECRVQYRIPRGLIGQPEAIGLGVILFPTEVVCADSTNHGVRLQPLKEFGGYISDYLRTYQTVSLDRIPCDSDLLVKNWSMKIFRRYGYSQGPATIGTQQEVEQVKKLVEFTTVGLSAISAFIFIIFYLILRTLQRVTQTSISFPPFDQFRFFWFGFIILISGYLFEVALPFTFSFPFVSKLTNFFGLVAISGPAALFISMNSGALPSVRKVVTFLVASPRFKFWPLIVLVFVLMATPYFRYIYPYAIGGVGIFCLLAAVNVRNMEIFFYGVCLALDGLKVLMVPGLPASRVTVTYMLFIFAYGMKRQIGALEQNARFEAGSAVAHQIAHDIRSPVGALKSVVPMLSGSEEIRGVALTALKRIQSVADDLLRSSRAVATQSGVITREDLLVLTEDVVAEKRLELNRGDIEITEVYVDGPVFVCLNSAMYGRIISNILNNSVEALHLPEGKIKVAITVSDSTAAVTVSDNGSGIPPNVLDSIGRKGFSTKDSSSYSGAGIGVFNAKKVLGQWNAQLSIASLEGQYTEVTITFPLANVSTG